MQSRKPSDDEDDPFAGPTLSEAQIAAQVAYVASVKAMPTTFPTYEAGRVEFTVRAMVPKIANKALRAIRNATGGELTLPGFLLVFPQFPLAGMTAVKPKVWLHVDPKAMFPFVLSDFTKSSFHSHYADLRRECGDPCGVVLQRRGCPHGVIVHSLERTGRPHGACLRWQGGDGPAIHLQRYDFFLRELKDSGLKLEMKRDYEHE